MHARPVPLPLRRPTLPLALVTVALVLGAALRPAQPEPRAARLTPKEKARVELGRRLFFDPVVSRSSARACASCHDPAHGYSDRQATSADDVGPTRRKSQTLIDSALNPNAHWDGEFESLEDLVTARLRPVSNGKGLSSHGAALGAGGGGGQGAGADLRRPAPPPPGTTPEPPGPPVPPPPPPPPPAPGPGNGGGGEPYGSREPEEPAPTAPAAEGAEREGPSGSPESAPPEAPAAPAAPPGQPAPVPPAPAAPPPGAPAPAAPPGPAGAAPKDAPEAPEPEEALTPVDVRRLPRVDIVLEAAGRYREAFQAAYGSPDVSVARIADAIGAYCRTIESTRSPYDRFRAGEAGALSPEQQRGLALFSGPAGCARCHSLRPAADGRVLFTDFQFHDTGVAWREFGRADPTQARRSGAILEPDKGREAVSTRPADRRAFKTPSLRDVALRGPWFHDGSARTLDEAVRYYVDGGSDDPVKSPHVSRLPLTDADVRALVAFLEGLTGEARAGLAEEAWARRAERAELTLVDGAGQRLSGFEVTVLAAGDLLPGWTEAEDAPQRLTTDARGRIAYRVPRRTHVRLVLPDGLVPVGGDLVPDTCASARVTVPVGGRVRLVIDAPTGRPLPEVLEAEHLGTMRLPGHPAPRTRLRRLGSIPGADGRALTLFAGWRRTDVPAEVRLWVPAGGGAQAQRLRANLLPAGGTLTLPLP